MKAIKLITTRGLAAALLALAAVTHSLAAEIISPLPTIITGTLPNGLRYTLVPLAGQQQRIDVRLAVEAVQLTKPSSNPAWRIW